MYITGGETRRAVNVNISYSVDFWKFNSTRNKIFKI